jgi:hypothetical protein
MEITTSKYSSLDLEWMSDIHYKCSYGYFILRDDQWIFIPFEQEFNTDILFNIANALRNLNENINNEL